ncbi:hypothetical protein [Caldivirga maquilingensis]|uniref:hypothetical protein n=1 Tax=Caldivirga maquilingensis TaxID=76887 RepID=UPI00064FE0F5|nr:hypothetical protein [Caldivirga maquilingensis]
MVFTIAPATVFTNGVFMNEPGYTLITNKPIDMTVNWSIDWSVTGPMYGVIIVVIVLLVLLLRRR